MKYYLIIGFIFLFSMVFVSSQNIDFFEELNITPEYTLPEFLQSINYYPDKCKDCYSDSCLYELERLNKIRLIFYPENLSLEDFFN